MWGVRRGRSIILSVAVAMGGLMLLVGPVFGASHEQGVRLHMGTDFQSFDDGSTSQPITFGPSGCVLSAAAINGPLVEVSTNPGGKVGMFDLSIGVKSGGSNGVPCSLVDDSETLILESANGQSWLGLRADIEAKGNAHVIIELFDGNTAVGTFELLTGSSISAYNAANDPDEIPAPGFPYKATSTSADPVSACANISDSGPDNGPNDNCLWTIEPAVGFDRVELSTVTGYASLEGSEDFENDPAHDTIFFYNQSPDVTDDSYTTGEDTVLSVNAAAGVLANDDDPESHPLTVTSNTNADHGTVTMAADGSFDYTPDENYYGPDGFDYTASDGMGGSTTGHVDITVTPVNDAPVALGASKNGDEDTTLEFTVGELGSDVENDPLYVKITSEPTNGSVVIDPVTGAIKYTPDPNFFGSDSFEYEVCEIATDLCSSTTATVTIGVAPVNDAPTTQPDSYEFDENSSGNAVGSASGVLSNDSDVENDPITAVLDTGPANGTLSLAPDGSFTYTPDTDYYGPDGFTYHATDGAANSAVTQVDITVVEVVCSDETVSDTDGTVAGSFTLIATTFQCKRYALTAYEATKTIDFELGTGPNLPFRGILEFGGQAAPGGVNSLELEYDPDGAGPEGYRTMQVCIDPTFDGAGNVLAPIPPTSILPVGETWCLASMMSTADGTDAFGNGLFLNIYQVYGESDPGFRIG